MRKALSLLATGFILALLAGGWDHHVARSQPAADKDRDADREAIRKSAAEFAQAFEKGDAKTIAAQWTEQGEFRDDAGTVLRGRAAIEKAYTEQFKAKPKDRIEVEVKSIRFLARDLAVEDGVLRLTPAGTGLPSATAYSALHIREDGKWKIASVHETGAAEDKLDDLAWLIGTWAAKSKDREMQATYEWNAKKTQIRNRFVVREGGKVTVEGSQTIAQDPQSGRLRSWMHEDEGGHGQALWFRDGNRWVQDALGVLPDGRETSATNIITRLNDNEFLWRSTHRTLGAHALPDSDPVRLTRVQAIK